MNNFHPVKWFVAENALLVLRAVAIATALIHTFPQLTSAQVTPDGSLGTNPSVVVPESATRERIEGGVTNNTNLFHSFQDFTIETGQEVYFANPVGIETILTRVTGNTSSELLGTLGVLGAADFFLINPNGIIFGPDAQLDIGGSFVATTAAGVQFENQGLFSASDPQVPTILTVNPSALFFSETDPGQIINRSVAPAGINASGGQTFGLRVPDGESLLLAGGEVLIDSGWLNALGGHIDLLGIAGSGQVAIITDGTNSDGTSPGTRVPDAPLSLNVPTTLARNDVTIQNEAILDVRSDNRGSITISGQNIGISGSRLFAGIAPGLGTANSQGGDIILSATDDLILTGFSPFFIDMITNTLRSGAMGNSGSLSIEAKNFIAQNAAFATVGSFGNGNAGEILVNVQDKVTLTESSTLFNIVVSPDNVESGKITVQAGSLELLDGAQLISSVFAVGQTEGVQLEIRDDIVIDGVDADGFSSGLFVNNRSEAVGFSGDVFISANSIEITRGGRIQTGTSGEGNAGNVTIEVAENFFLDGADSSGKVTGIFTDVDTGGVGEGGDIQVMAGSLTLNNGAQFTANTFFLGNAGNITVDVQGDVSIDGAVEDLGTGSTPGVLVPARSGLFSSVGESLDDDQTVPAFGNGGIITLTANSLSLADGGALATSILSDSIGNAAPITVTVQEDIVVDGVNPAVGASGIFTAVQSEATGNASDITISAEALKISRGALLNASIANDGIAGEILLNTNSLEILEGGRIIVTTSDIGNAGDIIVPRANRIILAGENSGLFANTTATSTGNSGSIFVDANTVTIQDRAKIALDSQGSGRGGDVELFADFLTLDNNALISTETTSTQGGIITLDVDDVVLLRNGSNLSATAGLAEANGDGGNVNIKTNFLVAVPGEDSNITANAFLGQGGNVQITAEGIYGIEFQTDEVPIRNDITASSAFGAAGEVDIDTLTLDPTRGNAELPTETGTPRISQHCNASQGSSSFISTGRGGKPLGPEDTIASQDLWEDLYTPSSETTTAVAPRPQSITPESALTEAQGWARNPNGHVVLLATAEISSKPMSTPAICSHQG
ncbi:two-partner secretion domain-containing protein [Leptothoe spongobia]|uniref:Filamentous hemagglutinin N-terminal domain-containing protein n=1 Tax=Leptothoe spongobia TAU-MAC 1115 TaxID=1967444 RepID=A0A947GJA3_9CYAN|nr:filamentous hemagglutinin N-terminal domain-containing protein [Leptothoe spongobia]MBT9315778.1 filamentous hemagglutinin N-terminal domain-containing protein [Leptothoe spongobia TAU-MAC 1115]